MSIRERELVALYESSISYIQLAAFHLRKTGNNTLALQADDLSRRILKLRQTMEAYPVNDIPTAKEELYESALRAIAEDAEEHTGESQARLCCKYQDIALKALEVSL